MPSCVVIPAGATDIATAVKLLRDANLVAPRSCKFAIRSGGNTPFADSANIQDGITIDLSQLNEITASEDKTKVTVSTGNR